MEMAVNYINNVIGGVYGMEKIDEVIIEGHAADSAVHQQSLRRFRKCKSSSAKFSDSNSLIIRRKKVTRTASYLFSIKQVYLIEILHLLLQAHRLISHPFQLRHCMLGQNLYD